jgi:cystathionine gamma-synthase
MKIDTRAVHAGRRIDPATGAVAPPIHLSTTFERGEDGTYPLGFSYSREGNPNRNQLEECLADLEGGTQALAFSSGLAVVTALVQGLEPGDHVLAPADLYYGFRKVFSDVFPKWPIEMTHVDMTSLDAVRAAVRPNTRLIWIETPSNPLLQITDLAAIAEIGHRANAISVCDATFTTPVVQRPFESGIDMVMHSTTKYISGHGDVVGGALITKFDNYLFERARKSLHFGGAVPSPFDCWLILRGISTLPCRVRMQCDSAMRVAQFLSVNPQVATVHYPGLLSHPGHALAARQMHGFGGMLSFEVRGGRQHAIDTTNQIRVFTRATSLGAVHSLLEHRASVEGPGSTTPQGLLRASIGLEHPDDLIADLDRSLR